MNKQRKYYQLQLLNYKNGDVQFFDVGDYECGMIDVFKKIIKIMDKPIHREYSFDTLTVRTDYSCDEKSTKYCKHCGMKIPINATICTICGRQI